MRAEPNEPTLIHDLATLADLYFTIAWNVGRRALRPQPRRRSSSPRTRRVRSAPRSGHRA